MLLYGLENLWAKDECHLSHVSGPSSGLLSSKDRDLLEKATEQKNMIQVLEHLLYKESLRDLKLFSLEKKSLRRDLVTINI